MLNKRIRLIFISLLILSVLSGAVWGLLYFKFGLKEYYDVLSSINSLPESLQNNAKNEFYSIATDVSYDQYGGIIAYVNTGRNPGIAIWGNDGLKYFKVHSDTVYSFYTLCTKENIEAIKFYQSYKILPTVMTDISKWAKKAEIGMSVAVEIGQGKYKGYAREVKSSDWYQFLPAKPYLLCVEK